MLLLKLLEDHLTLVRTLLEITPKDGITGEEFNCWTTVDHGLTKNYQPWKNLQLSLEESSVDFTTGKISNLGRTYLNVNILLLILEPSRINSSSLFALLKNLGL